MSIKVHILEYQVPESPFPPLVATAAPFSLIFNSWFPLFQSAQDSLGCSREGEGRGRGRKEWGEREAEGLSSFLCSKTLDWLRLGQMIKA